MLHNNEKHPNEMRQKGKKHSIEKYVNFILYRNTNLPGKTAFRSFCQSSMMNLTWKEASIMPASVGKERYSFP